MISAIIKGIFNLIMVLFNGIFTPFISLVTSLFPDLTNLFTYVTSFFAYCFTYIRSILNLLLIPDFLIILVFDYFAIKYTIYVSVLAIRFAVNTYNKFKI